MFVFVALLQRKAAGVIRSNISIRETRSINSKEECCSEVSGSLFYCYVSEPPICNFGFQLATVFLSRANFTGSVACYGHCRSSHSMITLGEVVPLSLYMLSVLLHVSRPMTAVEVHTTNLK
jgi:hypothetical protein